MEGSGIQTTKLSTTYVSRVFLTLTTVRLYWNSMSKFKIVASHSSVLVCLAGSNTRVIGPGSTSVKTTMLESDTVPKVNILTEQSAQAMVPAMDISAQDPVLSDTRPIRGSTTIAALI